ncbi:DUF1488 domain-containing protein [Ancylobacter dichloromethanicus]|uniref:DUF1488 domain-containing protein n=1 Tax=Ancylobacter dichloromethanicus TaxID=518825 RepID=A0A9W6J6W9_9HYPH|nr:DUF1488 domain-containing protein [Ancylobacter dichloromethanicus]MBS7554802.1 DUF1488 domain-containing protein [Ancylobacter dichloromethanicus]GLK71867.1 hypothetical protein GCM10017643_19830 [Ancylobacter dichloromethanicus]
MTLAFPNPSRSFDSARNAIRFTGYDGMFEVPFLIEIAALGNSASELRMSDALEAKCLTAFDTLRSSIYAAASKAYADGRRAPYILTSADIR